MLEAIQGWAWCAGRRAWCGRVVVAAGRIRREQMLLVAVYEWRSAGLSERGLAGLMERIGVRQKTAAFHGWVRYSAVVVPAERWRIAKLQSSAWKRWVLARSVGRGRGRLRTRRLLWAIDGWLQHTGASRSKQSRKVYAGAVWRHRLAGAAWCRWRVLHSLEMRVRICRTAWRLRLLAEVSTNMRPPPQLVLPRGGA